MQVLERNHQKRSWCWQIRIETQQWRWDNKRSSNTQHLMSAVCGFCYSHRSPACVPTCLPSATCTTWSLQQRRIKLFAKASGIVGIQCTVGPDWPPLCARRSFRQHTATDALTIVLYSSSLVVHTQSERNTVHGRRSRERRKCRRSSTGWLLSHLEPPRATWPPSQRQTASSDPSTLYSLNIYSTDLWPRGLKTACT